MATETILINCPAGEYTLIGESITNIAFQIRGQSTSQLPGGLQMPSSGTVKLRVAVAASEPTPLDENYWLYTSSDYMTIDISGANVYVMPDSGSMSIKLEVLRG